MTKTKPDDDRLRDLHKKHGGSIKGIAATLKRPYTTVRSWYDELGLKGYGKGGPPTIAPSDELLRRLHSQHQGNLESISRASGYKSSTLRTWYVKMGLPANGNKYGRTYPREIRVNLKDGFLIAFSDAHFWDEDKSRAHQALLVLIKKIKPAVVIANGDLLDGARISRHDPSGLDETPTFTDELHACRTHMAEIKRVSGGAETYLTLGNHDSRFSRYVAQNAPELLEIDGARLDHHILGWQFCWSVRVNDELLVMHRFRGGQHATFNNTLRSGMSIATGHLHSQRTYPFTDARGTRWGVDLGCLAEVDGPQFNYTEANPLEWRSGFAVFEFRNGKLLPPQLVTVLDDGAVWWQKNERIL